ncbi:thermonuclease family protein [Tardiphaga sp. 709]|uniref:thermonuclease family protein n=1 Tax=Tardiphaga sp. 709 TaxID=3076039 RepID=UPI0028E7568F|nr:thermonuclease family protein [Tardiphaga sp. 709]WNV12632.1 thermonuclease family protein [Tardiphaga sp. 709]
MFRTFSLFIAMLCIPALAQAADVTGVPKIRDGDQMTIGATRIRLAGMDSPGLDQLCLNAAGERWTCGVAAHEALVEHVGDKSWTCHVLRTDRFGRSVARCEVDGEDISQWMVKSGWALSYVRFSHAYDADEKAAREAKAGLWAGAFFAPWDWRVRNKKTTILGSSKPPEDALPILLASASGHVAPSPTCRIKGNVNRAGVCIYHTPESRWYAKISMRISKGTRWFCSKEEAEAAGCRETRR